MSVAAVKLDPKPAAKSNIVPIRDRVVIKREEAEGVSKGGIILPDQAKEPPVRGKVLAVGLGKKLDNGERAPMDVTEGDRVLFNRYSGSEVELDGEKYLVMSEEEILAVIK